MTRTPRIVVGVDGSVAGAFALDWAVAQAALVGADLEVVHAWFPPTAIAPEGLPVRVDPAGVELHAKSTVEQAVDHALARTTSAPPRTFTTLVRRDPARALEQTSVGARQVVVGTHGFGFLGRALLGSVADRAVTRCRAPVTVVPEATALPIGDGRIVVGVDGSGGSEAALQYAVEEAGLRHAPLVVVYAYPTVDWNSEIARVDQAEYGRLMIKGMLDVVGHDKTSAVPAVEVLAVAGLPGHILIEVATGASQLVVGYSGHDRRPRVLGSVSRRCVHQAPCPVTIVKVIPADA